MSNIFKKILKAIFSGEWTVSTIDPEEFAKPPSITPVPQDKTQKIDVAKYEIKF